MESLFDALETLQTLTVTELTLRIKSLLEEGFLNVLVVGEISSLKKHLGSGHVYLTLKDKGASIACVMFRSTAQRLRVQIEQGMTVVARGRLSVYPEQGKYQLYLDDVQPQGLGAQDLALRRLKEKLAKLGYFDPKRKRPLPAFPRKLALVTSPAGAAVRDMLEILGRRWPAADILICPVRVQGEGAAEDIAYTLHRVNRHAGIDVVILGRGGGSKEDLAAFNDEHVAEAIFHSRIPVISAVGHEIDVTIADLVADRRALTPSEAAELATPDRQDLLKRLDVKGERMAALVRGKLQYAEACLRSLAERPVFLRPLERVRLHEHRLDEWHDRLRRAMQGRLDKARHAVETCAAQLDSLSPLGVLARGYSVTRTLPERHVVQSADQVKPGEYVEIMLKDGTLLARVEPSQ